MKDVLEGEEGRVNEQGWMEAGGYHMNGEDNEVRPKSVPLFITVYVPVQALRRPHCCTKMINGLRTECDIRGQKEVRNSHVKSRFL